MEFSKKQYYEGLILTNKSIPFKGLKIRDIKIEDILDMGEDEFYQKILPFCLSLETLGIETDKDIKVFDILLARFDFLKLVKESLSYIFNIDIENITTVENGVNYPKLMVKDVEINRLDFEDLCEIVQLITRTKKMTQEDELETQKYKSENTNQQDMLDSFYKGLEHKKETKAKGRSELIDIYTFVANMDKDYLKIASLNITQLYKRFYFLVEQDRYEFNKNILINPFVDSKKVDLTPLYLKTNKEAK